jgi:hypothetical protein
MLFVNGEKVWVPARRQELIDGLERMGILKLAGRPLRVVPKQELLAAYCRERARTIRRLQAEQRKPEETRGHAANEAWQPTLDFRG